MAQQAAHFGECKLAITRTLVFTVPEFGGYVFALYRRDALPQQAACAKLLTDKIEP
jgi:hypothetical protein